MSNKNSFLKNKNNTNTYSFSTLRDRKKILLFQKKIRLMKTWPEWLVLKYNYYVCISFVINNGL